MSLGNFCLEAAAGFEPANGSFANCCLGPLGDAADLRFLVYQMKKSLESVNLFSLECLKVYHMRKRSWTQNQLYNAVQNSFSLRQVLKNLGLQEAGGNYEQVKKYIKELEIKITHFKGKGWNKGLKGIGKPRRLLSDILKKDTFFQSHKLKNRLFTEGLKQKFCEECNWAQHTVDGYLPLELDHINGDRHDNRIENLRILCPNCHSLKPTHRGRNKKKTRPGAETGRQSTLKML